MPGWDEVSPSLRPFGPNTPAAQALIVTPTGQVTSYNPNAQLATAQVPTGPAIGIKGTNAAAANSVRKQQQRDRAELVRQRKELEKQRQETVKIAKEEELGFVVEVAGLVAGTSAEDVQASLLDACCARVERFSANELTLCPLPTPDCVWGVRRDSFLLHRRPESKRPCRSPHVYSPRRCCGGMLQTRVRGTALGVCWLSVN